MAEIFGNASTMEKARSGHELRIRFRQPGPVANFPGGYSVCCVKNSAESEIKVDGE